MPSHLLENMQTSRFDVESRKYIDSYEDMCAFIRARLIGAMSGWPVPKQNDDNVSSCDFTIIWIRDVAHHLSHTNI